MSDRYSFRDVATIFDVPESRLRYWAQTGFINPSVRHDGRRFYTFADLIQVRAAKGLLDAGLSLQRVRKNLDALRAIVPTVDYPASKMRICSDGETVVARDDDDQFFEPLTGQLVMEFSVETLSSRVADVLSLPTSVHFPESLAAAETPALGPALGPAPGSLQEVLELPDIGPAPLSRMPSPVRPSMAAQRPPLTPPLTPNDWSLLDHLLATGEYRPVGDRAVDAYALGTSAHNDQVATSAPKPMPVKSSEHRSPPAPRPAAVATPADNAHQLFARACQAEEQGLLEEAEAGYLRTLEAQDSLSSAHTNLGNLRYRRGDIAGARRCYERALELEPAQPEARFNLGSVLEDLGELELAIAELRRVCWTHPRFADAHYNLGILLARTGAVVPAREHIVRYLQLEEHGEWADTARSFLGALVRASEVRDSS